MSDKNTHTLNVTEGNFRNILGDKECLVNKLSLMMY